jgi:hypothetical protein
MATANILARGYLISNMAHIPTLHYFVKIRDIILLDMIKSNLANTIVLILLGLTACLGYYQGFITLITRRHILNAEKTIKGVSALLIGLVMLGSAIVASGIAILYYFSL